MAVNNINTAVISGNLTADPELRETSNGTPVCELRVANNVPIKKEGNWESKVNFFQVNTWGGLAKNCDKFLTKGSPVTVQGRLDWQKWEAKEGGINSRVVIIADNVQFGPKPDGSKPKAKEDNTPDPGPPKNEAGEDIPF